MDGRGRRCVLRKERYPDIVYDDDFGPDERKDQQQNLDITDSLNTIYFHPFPLVNKISSWM